MKVKYTNDALELEVDCVPYVVNVDATADYTYDPGRMYMANGDPGYPPEESFELDTVDAVWYDEEGNEVVATDAMTTSLYDYLEKYSKELFVND